MMHDDKEIDLGDRLDELENVFEQLAATPTTRLADKLAKAQAIAMLSLAIDSLREVIADSARQEEAEASALRITGNN